MKTLATLTAMAACVALNGFVAMDALAQSSTSGKSAEEVAASLSNPNSPLASLNFENGFTWYKGDLPGADDQTSYSLLFQPILPFPLDNQGLTLFFRPAVPFLFNQPVFNPARLDFVDTDFGMGDISFDLAVGKTEKSGFLWAVGTFMTVPTATNEDFAGKQWRAGPELLLGYVTKKGILVVFPSHEWDVAGWSDSNYSVTNVQAGFNIFLGGGLTVGYLPSMSYNWETEDWTIPINLQIAQTQVINGQPWKYTFKFDYYVQQPDAFGPDFMARFTITPVVENPLANIFNRDAR